MTRFPFSVTIKAASANSPPQTVTCVGLLRDLGRKRQVLEATWDGRAVIAKIFGDPIKARYHTLREWRGLKHLQERGLNSPAPLFQGKSERYGWVVVTEKIPDAANVRQVWDQTTDPARRRELLCRVSEELARCHNKGVLQKDLHLGNFLLAGGRVFGLDPAQMRFLSQEVGKAAGIRQLAMLASIVREEGTETLNSLFHAYAQVRSEKFGAADMAFFGKKLAKYRKKGMKNRLRKCLRTSTDYQRIKESGYCGVATRNFLEGVDLNKLIIEIDELMEHGQILKDGNTCFVSRIHLVGREVVVKRYNHKGILHSVRKTIKRSRARRSWLHAQRLRTLEMATPQPMVYIEQRKGGLVWKSYFVTEHVKGQKLCDLLRDERTSKQERSEATQEVGALLGKLGRHRITHGDLKHTNILITECGPVLTDLDAMRVHKWEWTYRLRHAKDVARFQREGFG
ncbi:MAG: lipopolysaccharide kinase InaA family protein [Planctomycetota bacterium]